MRERGGKLARVARTPTLIALVLVLAALPAAAHPRTVQREYTSGPYDLSAFEVKKGVTAARPADGRGPADRPHLLGVALRRGER